MSAPLAAPAVCYTDERPSLLDLLRSLPRRLLAAGALSRQRYRLAELDEVMLRDIGLTRDQALREARRSRWDAPRHWCA